MASDLSNIIKDELANTLEQLLSKTSKVEEVVEADVSEFDASQSIEVRVKFEFKDISTSWVFFVPTIAATKFEYFIVFNSYICKNSCQRTYGLNYYVFIAV